MAENIDRTSTPESDKPIFLDDPAFSGEESGSSSPEPDSHTEEAIFTLLFQECDTEGTGLVHIDKLINFIKTVQLGEQRTEGDELYDSQIDLPNLQYNLHLLKAMLECNVDDDMVDLATYSHIITMWVRDVRSRSEKSANTASALEVSQLSDSGDGNDVNIQDPTQNWSYGTYGSAETSLEASGGHSSQHSLDRLELINSVADLKLENKRLQERNQQLQIQMENSEENLKDIQTKNEALKQSIKTTQAGLAKLEGLEKENAELVKLVEEMTTQCLDLNSKVTQLDNQLLEVQNELASTETRLVNADVEKSQIDEENKALQLLLIQKEEMLTQREEKHSLLESQLHDYQQQQGELSQAIAELNEANENLKIENADLHTQQPRSNINPKFPLSSTPYKPVAPSWHEELVAQGSVMNRGSPISPLRQDGSRNGDSQSGPSEEEMERISSESFSRLLEKTNLKINQTHNLLIRELSDIITQPSPAPSRRSAESSHLLLSEKVNDKSFQSFESRLTELLRKKKQLQNENLELSAQVADLTKRLNDLEAERRAEMEQRETVPDTSATFKPIPSTSDAFTSMEPKTLETSEYGIQTDPLPIQETSECHPNKDTSLPLLLPATFSNVPMSIPDTSDAFTSMEHSVIQTSESGIQTDPLHPPTIDEQQSSQVTQEFEAPLPTQFEEEPLSTPSRLAHLSRSLVTQHDIDSVFVPRASRSPNPIEEVDYEPPLPTTRVPTTGGPVVVGRDDRSLEELAEIKQRHQDLANQYIVLEQRAKQLEQTQKPSLLSSFASSIYNLLKGVSMILLLTIFIVFLITGLVLLQDAFDSCGGYCPHSPVQMIYSMLEPHLQYTRNFPFCG